MGRYLFDHAVEALVGVRKAVGKRYARILITFEIVIKLQLVLFGLSFGIGCLRVCDFGAPSSPFLILLIAYFHAFGIETT